MKLDGVTGQSHQVWAHDFRRSRVVRRCRNTPDVRFRFCKELRPTGNFLRSRSIIGLIRRARRKSTWSPLTPCGSNGTFPSRWRRLLFLLGLHFSDGQQTGPNSIECRCSYHLKRLRVSTAEPTTISHPRLGWRRHNPRDVSVSRSEFADYQRRQRSRLFWHARQCDRSARDATYDHRIGQQACPISGDPR